MEKETVFSSQITYNGIFSFKDFYQFCYDWLTEELGMQITEDKYSEKLAGDSKNIQVKWICEKKITDYFRFDAKVSFNVNSLKKIEITNGGQKVETNQGIIRVKIEGILARDYLGKFETSAFNKFLRGVYEKWIITSRVEEFKETIINDSDEFLLQSKAYLDLEGKRK